MSGIVNKAKEAIRDVTHPKEKHTHATTAHTGSAVPEGTAGPHGSRVANAADPRVDSDLDNRNAATGVLQGTAGPHGSRIANTADPRVDSDLDNRAHHHTNTGVHATHGTTTHTHGTGVTGTTSSTNAGPHSSNLANKLDPRVDSDLDHSRNGGLNKTTATAPGAYNTTTGSTAIGLDGTTGGSTNAGPHNSNLLNKVDPRVDSDLDRSRNAGLNRTTAPGHTATTIPGHTTTTTHTHATGTTGTGVGGTTGSTNAGPHNSNLLNKLDPRVDSDLDGSRNAGMNKTTTTTGHTSTVGTTGVGGTTGSTNAGPHNSNLLNKVDPRVDSDLDRSRNAGLNQTTRTNY